MSDQISKSALFKAKCAMDRAEAKLLKMTRRGDHHTDEAEHTRLRILAHDARAKYINMLQRIKQ